MNQRNKIVGIDASNLRDGGGATHLTELLRAAQPTEQGFTQIIVWGGKLILSQIEDRPWLTKIHQPMLDETLLSRLLWQKFHLDKLARQNRCNILFIPGGTHFGNFRPYVTMCQNMLPFEWSEIRRYGVSWLTFKYLVLRGFHLAAFRQADGLIFLSEYSIKALRPLMKGAIGKTVLIPHGVDERFRKEPKPQKPLSAYSAELPFHLLYVSQIAPYKHQWNVINAVDQLRKLGLPLTLELIGTMDFSGRRFNKALTDHDANSEWIHYQGEVPFNLVHESYLNADLFVFASSCESISMVLIESMAAGLPIACSKRGPMPSMLGNGAVYFDPEDPSDIARAIKTLVDDPCLRLEKSWKAFEAGRQYTWMRCAQDTFDFIDQVEQSENPSVMEADA